MAKLNNAIYDLPQQGGFRMAYMELRGRQYIMRELDGEEQLALIDLDGDAVRGLAAIGMALCADMEGTRLYPSVQAALHDVRKLPWGITKHLGRLVNHVNEDDQPDPGN